MYPCDIPIPPLIASWAAGCPSLPTPIQRGESPVTAQFAANGKYGFNITNPSFALRTSCLDILLGEGAVIAHVLLDR